MSTYTTLTECLPFEHHPEGTDEAVLLVHGYTGTPRDMRYLADRLTAAGWAVSVPRLPGAATDMSDLSSTTRSQWRRRVYDSWQDLKGRYETVHVIGYSMGGILAADLASRVDTGRLALLAPALLVSNPMVHISHVLAPFTRILPEIKTGWMPKDDDDKTHRELGRRYWSRRDPRSLSQFLRLQGSTRRRLNRITAPVLAVISSGDPTVPSRVIGILERHLPEGLTRSLVVERCKHDVPQGADRETVADAVIAWLSGDWDAA